MAEAKFVARSRIGRPARALYEWHMNPGAFERLKPPWETVEVLERPPRLADGARVVLRLRAGPLWRRWVAEHEGFVEGLEFRDVQQSGPFRRWVHTHRFEPLSDEASALEDRIEYSLPLGTPGRWLGGALVERRLRRMFRYRHAITRADLERHRGVASGRLHVAVSGAGGLVGGALAAFLTAGGHRVHRLVRRPPGAPDEILFDPAAQRIEAAKLEGLDAVVHLAGENIAGGRWTDERKRRIRESRVRGTRLVAEALKGLSRPPRLLLNASAIGYYGDRGDERVDETSASGRGFLAETCRLWEQATEPAEAAGVRVVRVRIGVVLAAAGGALPRMLTPFRLGAGGRVGSGRQYMSWIALDDLIGVLHHALTSQDLHGAVNAVAPRPVRNAAFVAVLARVLRRPALLPLPAAVVRLAFGEMGHELLLASTRVAPTRLEQTGFRFRHADLEGALRFELGRYLSHADGPAITTGD